MTTHTYNLENRTSPIANYELLAYVVVVGLGTIFPVFALSFALAGKTHAFIEETQEICQTEGKNGVSKESAAESLLVLERLHKLKEGGAINEQEFQVLKASLVQSMCEPVVKSGEVGKQEVTAAASSPLNASSPIDQILGRNQQKKLETSPPPQHHHHLLRTITDTE